MTLRGSVLEDAIPSTAKHSTARGLPLKEVLEHVIPELNVQCLRLAFNTPKVTEQLMKLDEQGVGVAPQELIRAAQASSWAPEQALTFLGWGELLHLLYRVVPCGCPSDHVLPALYDSWWVEGFSHIQLFPWSPAHAIAFWVCGESQGIATVTEGIMMMLHY